MPFHNFNVKFCKHTNVWGECSYQRDTNLWCILKQNADFKSLKCYQPAISLKQRKHVKICPAGQKVTTSDEAEIQGGAEAFGQHGLSLFHRFCPRMFIEDVCMRVRVSELSPLLRLNRPGQHTPPPDGSRVDPSWTRENQSRPQSPTANGQFNANHHHQLTHGFSLPAVSRAWTFSEGMKPHGCSQEQRKERRFTTSGVTSGFNSWRLTYLISSGTDGLGLGQMELESSHGPPPLTCSRCSSPSHVKSSLCQSFCRDLPCFSV